MSEAPGGDTDLADVDREVPRSARAREDMRMIRMVFIAYGWGALRSSGEIA